MSHPVQEKELVYIYIYIYTYNLIVYTSFVYIYKILLYLIKYVSTKKCSPNTHTHTHTDTHTHTHTHTYIYIYCLFWKWIVVHTSLGKDQGTFILWKYFLFSFSCMFFFSYKSSVDWDPTTNFNNYHTNQCTHINTNPFQQNKYFVRNKQTEIILICIIHLKMMKSNKWKHLRAKYRAISLSIGTWYKEINKKARKET